MIPYADFTYFVLLLYVAVPTVILGLFGRAGWRWALLVDRGHAPSCSIGTCFISSAFPSARNLASIGVRLRGNG